MSDIISIVALLVAILSVAWNIYRDLGLKSRLQVSIMAGRFGDSPTGHLCFNVVNCGTTQAEVRLLISRHSRRGEYWMNPYMIVEDTLAPDSAVLPTTIKPAETVRYNVPIDADCCLASKPISLGVFDSFQRNHWAPKKHVRLAVKWYSDNVNESVRKAGKDR